MSLENGECWLARLPQLGKSQLIAFPTSPEVLDDLEKANIALILSNNDIPSLDPSKAIYLPIRTHPAFSLSRRLSTIMEVYPQIVENWEFKLRRE